MLRRGSIAASGHQVKLICVLHPVGPFPASVYWRRRVFVLAAAIAVLVVLWLLVSSGGSSAGSTGARLPAAGSSTEPAGSNPPAGGDEPTRSGNPPSSDTLAATPPAADPGRPADGGSGAGTPTTGPSAAATTVAVAPPACSDSALQLTVAPAQPAYPVGALPEITLSVRNTSRQTCTRDLAASQQEVLLYAGATRLWSSNDCYPGGGQDVQALAPGERDRFSVTWSGLSSRPSCAGIRTRVGPGHYRLVGRIGTLQSPAATLTLR
jgi:hypothetical protein